MFEFGSRNAEGGKKFRTERVLWEDGMRNSEFNVITPTRTDVVVVGAAFSRDQFGDEKRETVAGKP